MSSILNVKKSPLHGKGVFANRNISKGEIIVESHMVLIHVNENLPEKLKHVHMTNPDNNFDLWLFKINNKLYIPILEITKNGLKEYAYEHKNIKNKILLKNILTYYNKSQTHPNEIFAYEVANQIMSEKLDDTIQKFLVNL